MSTRGGADRSLAVPDRNCRARPAFPPAPPQLPALDQLPPLRWSAAPASLPAPTTSLPAPMVTLPASSFDPPALLAVPPDGLPAPIRPTSTTTAAIAAATTWPAPGEPPTPDAQLDAASSVSSVSEEVSVEVSSAVRDGVSDVAVSVAGVSSVSEEVSVEASSAVRDGVSDVAVSVDEVSSVSSVSEEVPAEASVSVEASSAVRDGVSDVAVSVDGVSSVVAAVPVGDDAVPGLRAPAPAPARAGAVAPTTSDVETSEATGRRPTQVAVASVHELVLPQDPPGLRSAEAAAADRDVVLPEIPARAPAAFEHRQITTTVPTDRRPTRRRTSRPILVGAVIGVVLAASAYVGLRHYIYGDDAVTDRETPSVERPRTVEVEPAVTIVVDAP